MQWVTCCIICCISFILFTVGADTKERSQNGATPLMYVCFDGQTQLAQVLIAHGESQLFDMCCFYLSKYTVYCILHTFIQSLVHTCSGCL